MLTLVLILSQVSLFHDSSQANADYWPDESWRVSTLEEQDMNVQRIDSLTERLEEGSSVTSLLIIRNGYLVYESYRQGKDADSHMHIFSCTKSFTSALVGIAIREGYIQSIDAQILPYFSDWEIENIDMRKENLTIRHFLTMCTGLDWNEHNVSYSDPANMFNRMISSSNPAKFVLDLRMVQDPGVEHVYNTGASQVLAALIREITGQRPLAFAQEYLFDPLSISDAVWAFTRVDTNVGGTQLYIKSRDMARFGYLYLQNGTWNQEQIIPADYVHESQVAAISTLWEHDYGLHWWINSEHHYFCALGSNGQGIFIDTSHDLIMVITGNSDSVPMEMYFESYVQRAAREGYSATENESTPSFEVEPRLLIFVVLLGVGGVSMILIVAFPSINRRINRSHA